MKEMRSPPRDVIYMPVNVASIITELHWQHGFDITVWRLRPRIPHTWKYSDTIPEVLRPYRS